MNARPEILRKAADVIRTGGLVKGTFDTRDGQHCTVGALWAAVGGNVMENLDAEVDVLAEMIGVGPGLMSSTAIFHWNDQPETTAEDVVTLLEQAAEKLEAAR
jgi:RNAse (barnase) inhibitor barstar